MTVESRKKIFVARPYGTRKRERPRLRCLGKDLKTIKVRSWKSQVKNRNGILMKAKTHSGMSCHRGRKEDQ
ncbi:hypothetical protein TNCV_197961 [Trichonephila clavipes]|nr:hypothetical protein TNCV_197961 [Trichonephila clavipes]